MVLHFWCTLGGADYWADYWAEREIFKAGRSDFGGEPQPIFNNKILEDNNMTKTEKILVAKQNFRESRGRSIEWKIEEYLRQLRRENRAYDVPNWNGFRIVDNIGAGSYFYGTWNQAKLHAHRLKMWHKCPFYIYDLNTGIHIKTIK